VIKSGRFKPFLFILMAALLTTALWPAFQSPGPPEDEGIALVYPEMFLKGRLPYRDFETIYGPGNLLILSAGYSVFGMDIFVERAIGLVYRLVILLGIFSIAQRWGNIVAFGCALLSAVLLGGTELFANTWIAALAFALSALWLAAEPKSRWRCLAAGAFAGATLLCRCDLGPALIVASLPLFLIMERKERERFLGGAAVALLPLVWFAIAVGPAQLVHSLFLFPVFHLGSAAYLPISTAPADLRYVFYLYLVASVLNVGAGFVACRRGERESGRLLLGAGLLGLGCIHYALSRFDGGHVINTALISIGLLPLSLFVLFSAITRRLALSLAAAAATLIAFVGVQILLPRYTRYFYRGIRVELRLDQPRQVANTTDLLEPGDKGIFVKQNGRSFPLGRTQTAESTDQMLRELQRAATPGQLLLVGPGDLRRTVGCDTFIYHMVPQLRPATYYLEMNPGSTNAPGSRLASDVEKADWLVLDRGWDSINEPNQSSEFGSDVPNAVVRAKFDLVGEYGPYMLLRNRRLRNFVQPLPPQQ
jgi:hypothetical protein